ncbi:hypothetical protein [Defluviitalea raffinosedens]|nr:hypothetical protein [Defluviitalea raffinosedens]
MIEIVGKLIALATSFLTIWQLYLLIQKTKLENEKLRLEIRKLHRERK